MDIRHISLALLDPSNGTNPRKSDGEIAPLVASIKAFGLIEPLVVREAEMDGRFEVIAGNRRLAALKKINGKKDIQVPVVVRFDKTTMPHEIALAENVIRVNLHPVEEYDAYSALLDGGFLTVEEIAKRFGVKEKWVRQRLQLARLAPALRDAWRSGKMNAEQAEALSSNPDHAKQTAVWSEAVKGGEYQQRPDSLRREMRERSISASDPKVKLVTLDAYLAAGGAMTADLFTDHKTLDDADLVERLVAERLESEAEKLRADGWSFVETGPRNFWTDEFDVSPWMTPEERGIFVKEKRFSRQGQAIEEAARERAEADPQARAATGCHLAITRDGEISVVALQLRRERPDDEGPSPSPMRKIVEPAEPAEPADDESKERVNHPLRLSLSEIMTAALSLAIREAPQVAIPALYATLRVILMSSNPSLLRLAPTDAWAGVWKDEHDLNIEWAKEFKSGAENEQAHVVEALAHLVANIVDARVIRHDPRHDMPEGLPAMIDALVERLPSFPDKLAGLFDAEAYFARVTAADCRAAIAEMKRPPPHATKKADLAKLAATYAKERGWLPRELRTIRYEEQGE
jgi:ParB family chromosome partitioning protein